MAKSSITDIPRNVSLGEKDNFGIEPFENGLTKFIENTNTPITIALQGEWGSGKTSLMNSLKKNLSDSDNSNFHSIWLNTWEYALMKDASSTLIDIISKLIDEVSKIANVDNQKKNQLLKNVKKIGFSALKVASSLNSIASSAMDEIEKSLSQEQEVTISQIRDELENIISDCLQKDAKKEGFIFFIDDLDRIDPPVAVQLLELLKNIFTLKNCVFVLAIDYDVVIKGLEPKFGKLSEQNEREFRSFFDKIIQVPFSMPVTSYKIDTFLKESLVSINYISETHSKNEELVSKFSEISNLSVGTNPRALKRLMNSLSLISCINSTKNNNQEDDQLNEELELLINYALVSIQIAYPPVYRLLSLHSAFDKWNENVALQMNLKPLDQQSIDKLNQSEEFDEEWEKVLFRLCENDHYLKKRALSISRLLNALKVSITEKGEDVEDIIGSVISLSSVTNLEAFDTPVVDYHRGNFLKHLRHLLLPQLKKNLPEIANQIKPQGKRVQSNAFIKFTDKDWGHWIKLHSHPFEGGVRLIMVSDKWVAPINNHNTLQDAIKETGLENEFKQLETDYNNYISNFPDFKALKFYDEIANREGCFVLQYYAYLTLPNTSSFYDETNTKNISLVITEMYKFLVRLDELKSKVWQFYKPT
ncbi:P-loop NTPase fold protein [Mesoflavibacter sp. CH_XMU1404-2]|uniref:KAP family P-loop NTPase fold protein n=1 Tax=Mesoflavibacter sp. CH_XMU1404-2 TaxID=3107766 RepID=UPI003007FBB5